MIEKPMIGVGAWAWLFVEKAQQDFWILADRLKQLGFDGVELFGKAPHPNPTSLETPNQRKVFAKKLLEEYGLKIPGLAADFWDQGLTLLGDHEQCERYLTVFRRNCSFAADIGAKLIRVDSIDLAGAAEKFPGGRAAAKAQVAKLWRQCADFASNDGLTVVWEFEPMFEFNRTSEIIEIVDLVDRPHFKILYDTCHGHMCGVVGSRQGYDAPEVFPTQVGMIRKLGHRIGHVHLIDANGSLNEHGTSAHPPFGMGVINFDAVVPALAALDINNGNWLTIDLCFWPEASRDLAGCIEYVRKLRDRYFV